MDLAVNENADDIGVLESALMADIAAAADEQAIEAVRVAALGKKGSVSEMLKTLGAMSAEERQIDGAGDQRPQEPRHRGAHARARPSCSDAAIAARLAAEKVDVTLPVRQSPAERGRIHPISQVIDEIAAIFGDLGFADRRRPRYRDRLLQFHGAEFPRRPSGARDARHLLLPAGPDGERKLLRTHTSPVQIRTMEAQKPPIRIVIPGKTYRQDSDATHSPMFHQVEGLVIDKTANVANMKWVLEEFCKAFFEVPQVKMRFRPSFFPFTEPSLEVDIQCDRSRPGEVRFGEGTDWMEILGCGMVHPNVLRVRRARSRRISGLCLGHGHRPHRHAEIRHAGPARLLRRRCPLAAALRLPPARHADAVRRAVELMTTLLSGMDIASACYSIGSAEAAPCPAIVEGERCSEIWLRSSDVGIQSRLQ